MKKLLLVTALVLTGCGEPEYLTKFREVNEHKVVLLTKEAIETGTQLGYNPFAGGFKQLPSTQTVYYVVYTDGTTEQVDLARFATLAKGDTVTEKKLVEYQVKNPNYKP